MTVDVESLVNTLHTNDIIVIVTTTLSLSQSSECSPLSIACKHGAVNSAELLLMFGANPDGCENVSRTKIVKFYVYDVVLYGMYYVVLGKASSFSGCLYSWKCWIGQIIADAQSQRKCHWKGVSLNWTSSS